MKIYKGDKWIPPFSTRLNCINTIDAECTRNLTLEECMKKCNDSNYCNAGYFVRINRAPQGLYESYCVPLNTVSYHNVNILETLSQDTNSTKLSQNKDIEYTLFYNEKRFPEKKDYPKNFNTFLFSGNNVYLKHNDTYLSESLIFENPSKKYAFKIIKYRFKFEDLTCRITNDMSFTLSDKNGLNWIIYDSANKLFKWSNNSDLSFNFNFRKAKSIFINQGDPFELYNAIFDKNITIIQNRLALSDDSFSSFQFEKSPEVLAIPKDENKLEKFLCDHYKDCDQKYVYSINYLLIIIFVFICFIIILWIFILYRLMRK
jgi:hypothetical protein